MTFVFQYMNKEQKEILEMKLQVIDNLREYLMGKTKVVSGKNKESAKSNPLNQNPSKVSSER